MKEIKAYIKPHKLLDVAASLHTVKGLSGMSLVPVRGFGRGEMGNGKAASDLTDFVPHTKIEIICEDELVKDVVAAIKDAAHTGLRGDGKIYVSPVEFAVRISTGEQDDEAV